jgi:hypothetical protein
MGFKTDWGHLILADDAFVACGKVIENSGKRAVDAYRSIHRLEQAMHKWALSVKPVSWVEPPPLRVTSADVLIFRKK